MTLANVYPIDITPYFGLSGYLFSIKCKHMQTCQVVLATIHGLVSSGHISQRLSAYVLRDVILQYYSVHRLFPDGLVSELPCVRDWALKAGACLKKLVLGLVVFLYEASC